MNEQDLADNVRQLWPPGRIMSVGPGTSPAFTSHVPQKQGRGRKLVWERQRGMPQTSRRPASRLVRLSPL